MERTIDTPRAGRAVQPSGHRARPGGRLPDGPAMSALRQGMWFHRDPLGMTQAMQARYGDVFTLRMPTEGAVVAICAPGAAEEMLHSDPAFAHGGEGRQRVLGIVAPRSILGADAGPHDAARARVAAVFTRAAIARHRDAMAAIAERHVAAWPRGRPFRLLPRMRALVDEIYARLIVGMRDEERARALAAAVQRMLYTPGNPPLSPPGTDDGLLGQLGTAYFARRAEPVRRILAAELDRRRAADDAGGDDVLGAMLRADLDTNAMLDESVPLLMAGQEPPAAALTWLLDRIGRHPGLAEQVLHAPDAPETDRIRREALRLRPAVAAIMRRLVAPARIAGVDLPGGVVTMMPIPFVHHDARAWEDAAAFRPERFASSDGDAPRPYLPFGGGARRCPGEHLAHAEMDVVLPAVLRQRRLRPLWPVTERMVVRGTVLVPHRSGLAVAQGR